MRKKLLSFALALCLIVPCAILLTACGDDPKTIYVGEGTTLEMAVNQAKNGDTIVLQEDVVIDDQIDISKKITIDLGEHSIINEEDIAIADSDKWSLISVKAGGDLTIKNGSLIAKEGDCYAIDVRGSGKLTIVDGTYIGGHSSSIYVHTGICYILGGNFDILTESDIKPGNRYTINCLDANHNNGNADVIISGGSFANWDPADGHSEDPNVSFLADGYTTTNATVGTDTIYTVVAE